MTFLRPALLAASFLQAALLAPAAFAQYPSKPVTIVVTVPPGSSTDLMARILADHLTTRLKQRFVVENRPGASGLIAAGAVARAAPDGYTLAVAPSTLYIAPHVLPKGAAGGVDVVRDLTAIVRTASSPMVLLVNPQLGVKSVAELIAHAKATPGLAYATSGNGSPMHIAGELFGRSTGVSLTHVPYKGVMPAVQDTIAGQVKVAFSALGGITQFIQAGRIVPLAVVGDRTALLPNLPTLQEAGVKGTGINSPWFPLLAPAATPGEVIAKLNAETNAILQIPEVRERLLAAGVEPLGSTPDDAQRLARDEYQRLGKIVADFGIKGE